MLPFKRLLWKIDHLAYRYVKTRCYNDREIELMAKELSIMGFFLTMLTIAFLFGTFNN
jgi:hypothetical protein